MIHASRSPRPGERDGQDFHFRSAEEIRQYDSARFFVYAQRDQMRAVDLEELAGLLADHERVVLELNPGQVTRFLRHDEARRITAGASVVTVLLQPLSFAEVDALVGASGRSPQEVVAGVMRPKQIHRALGQGKLLTAEELHDIDVRAAHAWDEMRDLAPFDVVVVNHDAEGSDHWRYTPPIGDAGSTLKAVAQLLAGP